MRELTQEEKKILDDFGMRRGVFTHLQDLIDEWLVNKKDLIGIEIGSYAGESTEMFINSGAFKTLYCIDPWQVGYDPDDETACKKLLKSELAFDIRFKNNPVVKKLKMTSSDAVFQFEDNSIDFVYIDGNHQYEFTRVDILNYFPKVKSHGIIAGHDYGGPTTPGVKRAVLECFCKPPLRTYLDYSWMYVKA